MAPKIKAFKTKRLKEEKSEENSQEVNQENIVNQISIPKPMSEEEVKHLAGIKFHQSEIARLNTEKSNHDILLKTINELRTDEIQIRKAIQNISQDANTKSKIISNLDNEIRAMNYQISKSKDDFDKANAERVKLLDAKEKRINTAEIEYQKVILELNQNSKKLKMEIQNIADERKKHAAEIASMREWVNTNTKNLSALEKDIENRELDLKTERELFEKERDDLKPEMARISEIKNENLVLCQKLETEKLGFEVHKKSIENYKSSIDSQMEVLKAKLEHERDVLRASESRLRQWEEGLNDQALELKAREAEAQRMMKRYQLTKSAE